MNEPEPKSSEQPGPDPRSPRAPWWQEVEDELAAAADGEAAELPDPWSTAPSEIGELTAEQTAFLTSLEDQPGVIRLRGAIDDAGETPEDDQRDA
jgi:hypothetical protein